MKKNSLFLMFVFCLIFIPLKTNAAHQAVLTSNVHLRSGAGTNYSSIKKLSNGTEITVMDKTLYSGTGCTADDGSDSKWYQVTYDDTTGYICSEYITFINSTFSGINVVDWTARVSGNNVTVRKGAGTNYDSIEKLSLGVNVTILSTVNGGTSGCSDGKWYKIKYYNDSTGYICSKYITFKKDITASDEAYEQSLKEAGFPESYWPYLTHLHKKFPNWTFNASITDLDFSRSVNAENGKNYMQTTNDNYRTSSTPAEGSTWFKVNSGVIAFYMDPRNWLNEKRIFMFEKQDYSTALEDSYLNLVKSIFGSGALGDDKYIIPMVNAGKSNLISPVLIASRIRIEVGANGSKSTSGNSFTWKGKTYSGYYNFFNIGAYEQTIDGVKYTSVQRGLAYAAKLIDRSGEVWDNIQTAITEGSTFLANGYINKGQGSLYYQKFNTSPNAYYDSYTHQYQTNIQAPAVEGNEAYNSYNENNLLSSNFVFDIPVYKNMPAFTSLPNSGDTNNNLKSLSIEGYNISPDFDNDIITYTTYVPKALDKINIIATAESSKAIISGIGEVEIDSDENIITVTVTSETGDEKKYTITVNKIDIISTVENVLKEAKGVVNGNYITEIAARTTVNDYKNSLIKAGASSVTIVNSKDQSITGASTITTGCKITISTPNDLKTFTLVVKGDTSGDGNITILDLLQIQKHIKKSSILSGAKLYAADTSGDGNVTILDLLQVQKNIKEGKGL